MDRRLAAPPRSPGDHAVPARAVTTYADHVALPGTLALPTDAAGVVVFAHGSGSGRASPRNIRVARALNEAGLGTLLLDLLTPQEERDRANVFDVPLLAGRLTAAVEWLEWQPEAAHLPVGLFGASTGAAAAIWNAAELGTLVAAASPR
jgi:putative phosphoribosyl transferase